MDWPLALAALSAGAGGAGFIGKMAFGWTRQSFHDLKDDMERQISDHDKRLDRQEQKCLDFMARGDILAQIKHEATNRIACDESLKMSIDRNIGDIVQLRIDHGKLETSFSYLTGQVGEVKQMLTVVGGKLDKLSDDIARKD